MAITFDCHHCGKSLTTGDDKAGRKAKCPGCGEVITVPEPDTEEHFDEFSEDEDVGESLRSPAATKICPTCGAKNSIRATACQACGEELDADSPERRRRKRGARLPETVDAGEVLSASWQIFTRHWPTLFGMAMICLGMLFLMYVVVFAILFAIAISLNGQLGQPHVDAVVMLVSFPLGLVLSFVVSYLNAGVNRLLLSLARGEDESLGVLFSAGHYSLRAFLISLLFHLMTGLGFNCCLVPGVVLWLMFWPYLYIIIDEDCGGIDALSRAKDLGSKNLLPVFLLVLVALVVQFVAGMTCVGLPFAVAYSWLTFAVAYCRMTGQATAE